MKDLSASLAGKPKGGDSLDADTQNVLIKGKGDIKLGPEELNLQIKGDPKKVRLTRLRTPIEVKGYLMKPSIGVDVGSTVKQGAIAAALGTLVTPSCTYARRMQRRIWIKTARIEPRDWLMRQGKQIRASARSARLESEAPAAVVVPPPSARPSGFESSRADLLRCLAREPTVGRSVGLAR